MFGSIFVKPGLVLTHPILWGEKQEYSGNHLGKLCGNCGLMQASSLRIIQGDQLIAKSLRARLQISSPPPTASTVLGGFFFFIELQLTYSVVPISCKHSKATQLYTYILFYVFFSIVVYYRILNIVPCATQQDLVVYLPIHESLHLLLPNPSPALPHPLKYYVVMVCDYMVFGPWTH